MNDFVFDPLGRQGEQRLLSFAAAWRIHAASLTADILRPRRHQNQRSAPGCCRHRSSPELKKRQDRFSIEGQSSGARACPATPGSQANGHDAAKMHRGARARNLQTTPAHLPSTADWTNRCWQLCRVRVMACTLEAERLHTALGPEPSSSSLQSRCSKHLRQSAFDHVWSIPKFALVRYFRSTRP